MGYLPNHTELQTIPKCKCLKGVGGHCGSASPPPPPLWQPSWSVEKPQAWWGGKGLARRKIRRIMSALITMYTKTAGSVRAQTEQLSQIGWARGFSASTLTLISLCALRLPTFRHSHRVTNQHRPTCYWHHVRLWVLASVFNLISRLIWSVNIFLLHYWLNELKV